jgi:beta-N-acetylhexosaminidase
MAAELEKQVASLFLVGFQGRVLSDFVRKRLDQGVGGLILFRRNIEERDQVGELVERIRAYRGAPLLVAVDQEGGRVQRLREGFSRIPTARELAESCSALEVEAWGKRVGLELRSVGINWNFAPVLDVDTNPNNPIIGDRSFSRDPQRVATLGIAFARGLEAAGVASCGKHFPGHGDTSLDSHLALPSLLHDGARLRAVELVPFQAYCDAGLASIMTAHVLFPELEPGLPATLSPKMLGGLLRTELGFQGLLVSDDLEMKAIADHFGPERASVEGLNAGVDAFLACESPNVFEHAFHALVGAVRARTVPEARLLEACERMARFQERWALPSS